LAPTVHAWQDRVWKPARLENGVEIMVPQFIKAGELIRLDVRFMDASPISLPVDSDHEELKLDLASILAVLRVLASEPAGGES
jgi:hypothetical protein